MEKLDEVVRALEQIDDLAEYGTESDVDGIAFDSCCSITDEVGRALTLARELREEPHPAIEPIRMVRDRFNQSDSIDFAETLGLRSLLDHALELLSITDPNP